MVLDAELKEQAHQLFVEEALELLQQVQEDLPKLADNPTASLIHRLLEVTHIVIGGAVEVNLLDLQTAVERFAIALSSLEQEPTLINADRLDNLHQIYEQIWTSLLPYLPTYHSETSIVLTEAESTKTSLLEDDLLELENYLAAQNEQELVSQDLADSSQTNPETIPEDTQSPLLFAETEAKSDREEENKSLTSEEKLVTAKSFLWLSGFNLFVLPSTSIEAIVTPESDSIIYAEGQRFLVWQQQRIRLYRISELLNYNCLLPESSQNSTEQASLGLVDRSWQTPIINLGGEKIAIELEVDRFIVKSQLSLLPFNKILAPPEYFYGCTALEGRLLVPVVDVEALVNFYRQQSQPSSIPPEEDRDTSPTILVVDDSRMVREILSFTLEKEGYSVIQAKDGQEAIAKLQQHWQIRAIICDLEMPIVNGFELLKYCSNHSTFAFLPAIALTSHNSREYQQRALELGATDYLTIPYQDSELLEILKLRLGVRD
jgi:chemotaxis family two-component system sensor histidine kinase/response regulator PixL